MVLTCTAQGSFTYKWVNNSAPVVADGTHVKLNANELTVSEVRRTDLRGPIICIAENALESGKSDVFNLTVSCKYMKHTEYLSFHFFCAELFILTHLDMQTTFMVSSFQTCNEVGNDVAAVWNACQLRLQALH